MGKNKVKFGLSNVVVAPFVINAQGEYVYDTPIAIPGAVNLSLSPSGDETDFYADDVKYYSDTANQGYDGDLEVALLPDSIRTAILGETTDSNGALVEKSDAKSKGFALGFQIDGDSQSRKCWYYNCKASRPANNGQTKEASVTPQTDTLSLKAMPRLTDKLVRTFLEPTESNKTVYDAFFTSVYEPVEESSE